MATVICDADTDTLDASDFVFLRFKPVVLNDLTSAFSDTLLPALGVALVEDGDFVDTPFDADYSFVAEQGDLGDVFLGRNRARPIIADAPAAGDSAAPGLQRDVFETADFAVVVDGRALPTLFEDGDFSVVITPRNNVDVLMADAADFATAITAAKPATLLEDGDFGTSITPRARSALQISELADFSTTLALRGTVISTLADTGDFSTLLAPRQTTRPTLADEADLDAVAVVTSGAWSANTDTWAASRYDPYTFDGMVSFAGRLYAVGAGGLALVGADADAGAQIDARIDTGLTEFRENRLKLAHALYLGYSSDTPLTATIGVTADGRESQYGYPMPPRAAESFTAGRIPLGRGLRSRYMRVVLENSLGGDFFIDEAAIEVDVSTRRI